MRREFLARSMVLGVTLLLTACATTQELSPRSYTTIVLEKPVHFVGADGADRVVPAGQFEVSAPLSARLQLTPVGGGNAQPSILAAEPVTVPITLLSAAALSVPYEDDEHSVVWVRPDGTGLEAIGTYSGITTRKDCDASCMQRLQRELQRRAELYQAMLNALRAQQEASQQIIRNIRQ